MVPCALLIENRGGGYQLRPLEESTSYDSRDSVIPSTSPSLYTLHLYGTFHVMRRTMRLKPHPMPEQAHTLTATHAQFTNAFNWVCAYGWEHNEKNGVRLHHATYYPVKKVCPGLVSDLVIQARDKATEVLKSAFTQRKVSCPWSQRYAARYKRLHAWSFAQRRRFVVYKTEEAGLDVVAIDPRHTSQPARTTASSTGQIGARKPFSSVGTVDTRYMQTSTRRKILRPNTVPVVVYLRLVRRCQPAYRPLVHARRRISFLL